MPGWSDIVNKVEKNLEIITEEYLKNLFKYTNRNTIVYYSAWQQKKIPGSNIGIDDNDLNGFMSVIKGMKKELGLDLLLHTPGGEIGAAQKIVEYIKNVFDNDIRVIVPHTAMSAGTMIACASKEIFLGKHSFLGPIDPQLQGIPVNEFKNTINRMKSDINSNKNIPYWKQYMIQLPPQLEGVVDNIIKHSNQLVSEWLKDNMFSDKTEKIEGTVKYLADYSLHRQHNNCLNISHLRENTDLEITELESDSKLQDLVLSVYHSFQIFSSRTSIMKIITNQNFDKFIVNHK